MLPCPSDYGIPHTDWRPYQLETLQFLLNHNGVSVLEAPTGSGKSAYAVGMSSRKTVTVLTRTRQLQQQYRDEYRATVLYGKANYPCNRYRGLTAEDCPTGFKIAGKRLECGAGECSYLAAREEALGSPLVVLNYALALSARWIKNDKRQVVVLDEAHNLSDVTLEWAGCAIRDRDRVEFDLPDFPTIRHNAPNTLLRLPHPVDMAREYLLQCSEKLTKYRLTPNMSEAEREHHRRGMLLARKIEATLEAVNAEYEAWFVRSGLTTVRDKPGFFIQPLTARFHFQRYFLGPWDTVAMSATIGNANAFAAELGIEQYNYHIVPNRFPPDKRKVVILDVPGMGKSASEADFEHQADRIAEVLKRYPSWSGLVLVTRKREAMLLAERLAKRGLGDRVWVTPGADGSYAPTDQQKLSWDAYRKRVPNAICVTWAFWEGYNGLDEKICILAKTPFPYLGDEYERERMEYSRDFFFQRTAWLLEQGLGRTRRGRDQDYGDENGFVAIADADWTRVKKYLSKSIQEAIVYATPKK